LQTNYTERQIHLLYASALRLSRRHKADLIEAVNQGFVGGDAVANHIKQLRG